MTPKQAIAFVQANGVVLESGRGAVPTLAEAIAGAPIRGELVGALQGKHHLPLLPRNPRIGRRVGVSSRRGKVTYVHRRLWPALVRLAGDGSTPIA